MKIIDVINSAENTLTEAGIDTPRLDAEILLANVMSKSRFDLYVERDSTMDDEKMSAFEAAIVQRSKGCPVAYITGEKEFWSIPIAVSPGVLIPRPDTETVVEETLKHTGEDDDKLRILDLCTGSGCIAAALAKELPKARIIITDASSAALEIASRNLDFATERIKVLSGNLFDALGESDKDEPFDIIVTNPPYIRDDEFESLARDIVDFEPKQALTAGEHGLDFIARIIEDAHRHLKPGGWLIMEIGEGQAKACITMATGVDEYDTVKTTKDLAGIDRVISIRRSWTG